MKSPSKIREQISGSRKTSFEHEMEKRYRLDAPRKGKVKKQSVFAPVNGGAHGR